MNLLPARVTVRIAIALAAIAAPRADADEPRPGLVAEFAGDYYRGDGLGRNHSLRISRDGRFTFSDFPDVGARYEDRGAVEAVGGRLALRPERPESKRFLFKAPLAPVRWGARAYLLEDSDEEMLRFCNQVNLGLEPRVFVHGRFYARCPPSDEEAERRGEGRDMKLEPARGAPDLPARWRPYLLAEPRRGRVVEVAGDSGGAIDLGSEDGLRAGMEVWLEGPAERAERSILRVTAVAGRACTVAAKDPGRFAGMRVGQAVSTRLSKEVLIETRSGGGPLFR